MELRRARSCANYSLIPRITTRTMLPSHQTSVLKQTNTDDCLRVVSEDKAGPMLLEDAFGREKVRRRRTAVAAQGTTLKTRFLTDDTTKSINSIMGESPSVSCTPEAPARSVSSDSSKAQRMSHMLKLRTGRLVVEWQTISKYLLLYVVPFVHLCFCLSVYIKASSKLRSWYQAKDSIMSILSSRRT